MKVILIRKTDGMEEDAVLDLTKILCRVSDPYSFFMDPDPDPEDPDGYGSGSRALTTKN
jgi:hypothetical protein